MAVYLAIMSPQPLITERQGACDIMFVSAIIASGAWVIMEYCLFVSFIEANGLAMPSWEIVVGMLMKGVFCL